MIDLPLVGSQPYPSKTPWFDVSQYLREGLTPFKPGSVAATTDGNSVTYSFMIIVDRANPNLSVNYLMNAIHPDLRVSTNQSATGWFSRPDGVDVPHRVEAAPSGWVAMPRFPGMGVKLADFHLVSLSMTAPRSKQ